MKIAFIGQPFDGILPPLQNSIGIWIYEIAHRLARSWDVVIYTGENGSRKRVKRDGGVEYRPVSTAFDRWLLRFLPRFSRFRRSRRPLLASKLYYLGYILQVANDLRAQRCDMVHVLNFSQFVPVIRAFNPRAKIVLHMQCEWLTQLDRTMTERRLSKTDLIIGCSEYITEKIHKRFPEFANRCQTVYNGVDPGFFNRNSLGTTRRGGSERLLFVGRVSPEKGVHVLLDAFRKVAERYPRTRLEIIGPNEVAPVEFIVALSDDLKVTDLASFYREGYLWHLHGFISGLEEQVSFIGRVPHRRLIDYYRNADVFIFPSVWEEPFGIPLVEAMATGVPVVATRVGGMVEIVENGKTGLLVEPGDASALAEAILRLLGDEDLRQSMGEAARKRAVECYSWEKIAENLLCQYKSICKSKGCNLTSTYLRPTLEDAG